MNIYWERARYVLYSHIGLEKMERLMVSTSSAAAPMVFEQGQATTTATLSPRRKSQTANVNTETSSH